MSTQLPGLMTMLHELISQPSVSSTSKQLDLSNRAVIDLLASWLETLGFRTEILPLKSQPDKANLIATLGTGPGGLVLAGHTDTVPFDENRWSTNPLSLTEKDHKLYGLGATDMKGFFPIAIEACKAFTAEQLQQPLIILATADEESSMDGARELVALGRPKARCAVIGEPTNMRPITAHKGIMMECLRVTGQSGHSSNPELGNNALDAMHTLLGELIRIREELKQQYRNSLFEIDYPTLNLGHIHGGDNPNRICGQCETHFDLRPLPGMNLDELRQLIQQRLSPIAREKGVRFELTPLVAGVEPFQQQANSDIVIAAEKLTGYSAEAVAFATEAPFMQQLGMDTIVMGPGSIDRAHQPDEFMPLDQVKPAIEILKQLIQQFCL